MEAELPQGWSLGDLLFQPKIWRFYDCADMTLSHLIHSNKLRFRKLKSVILQYVCLIFIIHITAWMMPYFPPTHPNYRAHINPSALQAA